MYEITEKLRKVKLKISSNFQFLYQKYITCIGVMAKLQIHVSIPGLKTHRIVIVDKSILESSFQNNSFPSLRNRKRFFGTPLGQYPGCLEIYPSLVLHPSQVIPRLS